METSSIIHSESSSPAQPNPPLVLRHLAKSQPSAVSLPPLAMPTIDGTGKSSPSTARSQPDLPKTDDSTASVGVPFVFFVPLDASSYPQLTVFVTAPNANISEHSIFRNSQGLTVTFTPVIMGDYTVMFMSGGKAVYQPLTIKASATLPGNVKKPRFRVGDRVVCRIVSPVPGIKAGDIGAVVVDRFGVVLENCDTMITMVEGGYAISFMPMKKGIYSIDVMIKGLSVDQPVEVEVLGNNVIGKKQLAKTHNKENLENVKRPTLPSIPAPVVPLPPLDSGADLIKRGNPGGTMAANRMQTARDYASARIASLKSRGSILLIPKPAAVDFIYPPSKEEAPEPEIESKKVRVSDATTENPPHHHHPKHTRTASMAVPKRLNKIDKVEKVEKIEKKEELKEEPTDPKRPTKRVRSKSCKNTTRLEPSATKIAQSPTTIAQSPGDPGSRPASPKKIEKPDKAKVKREKYRSDPSKASPSHKISAHQSFEKNISKKLLKFKSSRALSELADNHRQIFVSILPPENFEFDFLSSYTVTVKKGESSIPCTLSAGPSDTLLVKFLPPQIGRYFIQIYNGNQPLYEDPIKVIVETLIRSGNPKNKAGERNLYSAATLMDKKGSPLTIYPIAELSAIMAGPDIAMGKIIQHSENNETNLYFEFVPPKPGLYKAQIYHKGAPILASSVGLPVDIELIHQSLSPTIQNFSDSTGFKISIRPVFNQNNTRLEYNSGDINAEIKTANHEILNGMTQVLSDGRIEVLFPSTGEGIHLAQVYLWGQAIMPAPIEINSGKSEIDKLEISDPESTSSVELARDEEIRSLEREERLREQCSKLSFMINTETNTPVLTELQADWKNIIQQAQPLFDRLDWGTVLTQSEESIFNYYKNITDSILITVNSITKVCHLFDAPNQEKIASQLEDIEKLFFNFFQLIMKTLKMDRQHRIEHLEEFVDYSKNIKSHFIQVFSLFKKFQPAEPPVIPPAAISPRNNNPTGISPRARRMESSIKLPIIPTIPTATITTSTTTTDPNALPAISPRPNGVPSRKSAAARRTSVNKSHVRVASDVKDVKDMKEIRSKLRDHQRVASSGPSQNVQSQVSGNDFGDILIGMETSSHIEPVTRLVNFLNSDMSRRISFESVCKPYMTPQTLRSGQLIFSELMKKLVPVLKDDGMKDPLILVPLISKPILMIRNIILETLVPEEHSSTFVQHVNSFSQVLIDILGLKLHGQPILSKLPEFSTILQNIFQTLKTLGS